MNVSNPPVKRGEDVHSGKRASKVHKVILNYVFLLRIN